MNAKIADDESDNRKNKNHNKNDSKRNELSEKHHPRSSNACMATGPDVVA